jgi:hypothetical protein
MNKLPVDAVQSLLILAGHIPVSCARFLESVTFVAIKRAFNSLSASSLSQHEVKGLADGILGVLVALDEAGRDTVAAFIVASIEGGHRSSLFANHIVRRC